MAECTPRHDGCSLHYNARSRDQASSLAGWNFFSKTLIVRRSKTEAGLRSIPMNEDAYNAILELRERALEFNGTLPEHFLFPACEHGRIDPNRAMKSWRTAWRKMTQLIQCPACREAQNPADTCRSKECGASLKDIKSPLAGLRFHDLRHHAITELAESQASDSTIMRLPGMCRERCWSTTATFGRKQSGTLSMCSRKGSAEAIKEGL